MKMGRDKIVVTRFTLNFTATAGNAAIVGIPLLRAESWSGLAPDLRGKLRLRHYGSSRIEASAR
jgi:hypothetical protein